MGLALVTKHAVNACQGEKGSAISVVHFKVGDAAVLMANVGKDRVLQCRGEWAYYTCSKVFKDKARLQFHS